MEYGKILIKSWQYLKRYKYLWFLGLLAGNSINSVFYSGNGSQPDLEQIDGLKKLNPLNSTGELVSANVERAGKVLGENISNSYTEQPLFWGTIVLIILVLLILAIYLSITSKGALVFSIDGLEDGKKMDLKTSWALGHEFFWRRVSFALLVFVLYFVPLLILSIPVIVLAVFEMVIPAVILGILLCLVYFAYSVYLSLFIPYAERILFLGGKNAYDALKSGLKTFNHNWKELILIYLIILGITLAFGIALAIVFFLLLVVLGLMSLLFYSISSILGIIVISILGIAVLLLFAIAGGGISAYSSSVLTMAYRSVRK